MQYLTYSEVLKVYFENIKTAKEYGVGTHIVHGLTVGDNTLEIWYSHIESIFRCYYNIEARDPPCLMYAIFCRHEYYKDEYYLLSEKWRVSDTRRSEFRLPLPQTPDEWFNFALMYEYTEEDFKNFKKIVEYYDKSDI